jgi:hypothetical protein
MVLVNTPSQLMFRIAPKPKAVNSYKYERTLMRMDMEQIDELFGIKRDATTGKLYVGKKPGDDQALDLKKSQDTNTDSVKLTKTATDQTVKPKSQKVSDFGAAFKAAREARLSGKGGDTFEYNGKQYHSYQKGEKRSEKKVETKPETTPSAPPTLSRTIKPAAGKIVPKTGAETYDDIIANGIMKSLPSSYSARLRESLEEARSQSFTDADIERQVAYGLGTEYDKNNPEHKAKADSRRETLKRQGRYTSPEQPKAQARPQARPQAQGRPQAAAASASQQTRDDVRSRTDRAARDQYARNSASARAQTRPNAAGARPAGTAGASTAGVRPDAGTARAQNTVNDLKSVFRKTANFGKSLVTPKALTSLGVGVVAGGVTGFMTAGMADNAKEKGQTLAAAGLKAAPDAAAWGAADAIRNAPGKLTNVTRGLRTAITVGGAETASNYMKMKGEKDPRWKAADTALSPMLKGAAYGGSLGNGPGAVVGGVLGSIKGASDLAGQQYKTGSEEDRARSRERNIARFGYNVYARQDAEIEAEKKKNKPASTMSSAVDRVRARQQQAGASVLKRPTQTP